MASSDAIVKQVSAIPWIAETKVALESLGYTEEQITRMLVEKRRGQSTSLIDTMAKTAGNADVPPMPDEDDGHNHVEP